MTKKPGLYSEYIVNVIEITPNKRHHEVNLCLDCLRERRKHNKNCTYQEGKKVDESVYHCMDCLTRIPIVRPESVASWFDMLNSPISNEEYATWLRNLRKSQK